MRIVSGRFGGRPLATPKDDAIRPTSDRVRQALFDVLAHGLGDFDITGVRVIDLFAGTGALGLEAMSRGAAYCLFVEEAAESRALIRRNVEALGLTGATRIFRRDATRLGPGAGYGGFGLAFLDPPYGKGLAEKALTALAEDWLMPGAVVVVEEAAGTAIVPPTDYHLIDQRTYGGTDVFFLRFERGRATAEPPR
jgi:16S rRNA (guanine966-N2)-methyltransferase